MPADRSDLNLFRVFDAVMRHRTLVAAGRELGITASAVSHALTRLRGLLGEELFLAGSRGMTPTARATALAPRISAALADMDEVLTARPFDPATSSRSFRIGASDLTSHIFLPGLVQRLLAGSPALALRMVPFGRVDLVEQLDEGRLDMVIGWFTETPPRIRRRQLFVERETLVVRGGHPLAQHPPTLAALLGFPHLVIDMTAATDIPLDGFFGERGLHRRVWIDRLLLDNAHRERIEQLTRITVPAFGLVPALLRGTDLVATLPRRVADSVLEHEGLAIIELPYPALDLSIEAAWHERHDHDTALQWLLGALSETCAGLAPLA